MNKRIIVLISGLALLITKIQAQDSFYLDDCVKLAIANYAGTRSIALYKDAEEYKLKSANSAYLPKLNLNAQASWQSQTTTIDLSSLPFPINIDPPPKDQYKAVLEINQLIFDAGATKQLKAIQQKEIEVNSSSVKVEQYKLEEQIMMFFLNILFLNKQIGINHTFMELLDQKLIKVKSGVENGVLLASNLDLLKVEIIKTEQQLLSLQYKKKTLIESLALLCAKEMKENAVFIVPEFEPSAGIFGRPEENVFDARNALIEENIKLLTTRRLPKLISFGQFGYGRPGLNFFSTEFEPYVYVGAALTWNIWDWNQVKNEKQYLQVQKELVRIQREIYNQNMELLRINEINNREYYFDALNKSIQMVELRKKISGTASSQLDNGIITASDYLTELTAEKQAIMELELNKLLLLQSQLNLELIIGKKQNY